MSRLVLPGDPLVDAPTVLRPWRDSDITALVRICQDPEIVRWTSVPSDYREADARAYLLRRHDAILAGTMAPFAIVSRSGDDEKLVGSISLLRIEWEQRRAEVGYFLSADARGAGHATRAVRLISRWGFDAVGVERIDLYAETDNVASQRVAERSGFQREALLRSFMRARGGQVDMVAFGLLATG